MQIMKNRKAGFTLVEIMIVVAIIGLLAAIAIPAFFNQRNKAKDADAKSSVRTAETAMETFATDNNGKYTGVAVADLTTIEPTLNNAGTNLTLPAAATDNTYTVQVKSTSPNGNLFQISRAADGTTSLRCGTGAGVPPTGPGKDGCPTSGDWGS